MICALIAQGISFAFRNQDEEDLEDALWFRSNSIEPQSYLWYCEMVEIDGINLRERVLEYSKKYKYRGGHIHWGEFQKGRTWKRKQSGLN